MAAASNPHENVPALPRASEVRETVEAVERGLAFLRGLAKALERVERSATQTSATQGVSDPDTPSRECDNERHEA